MPEREHRPHRERGAEPEQPRSPLKQRLKNDPLVVNVGRIDYVTLLVVIVLCSIGVVMVFSAGFYRTDDVYYYLKRQLALVALGFAALAFMANFDYKHLMKFSLPAYIGANGLVALVPFIGTEVNGAKRWIDVPYFGRFQPSELAKIAIIIVLAYLIHKNKDLLRTKLGMAVCLGLVGISAMLVLLGGLSNAIIVAFIGVGIIFIASPYTLPFVLIGLGGLGGVAAIIMFSPARFRIERISAWINPYENPQGIGFQIIQSLYAIASGGPFGLGVGQSRQKSFLPEAHNDFVFAIICEELGLLGAGLVIFMFAVLIWRGISIAAKAPDVFSSLTASGIVMMIGGQAIVNIAVVTNSIPNTGITLPFVSYGGTSLLVTMFLMGVLLNISRYSRE